MWSGSAIGSTPFGLSTPVAAPEPSEDGPALSRFIDVGAGDYAIDTTKGRFARMPVTRQRVLLVAHTVFGSSTARQQLGIRRPQKMDESFVRRMRAEVRRAYRQLAEVEGAITIERIDVSKTNSGRAAVLMEYTDHTLPADVSRQTLEALL